MGRHSLVEAPKHASGDALIDDVPTQFIPAGHDGASAPTEIIPAVTVQNDVSPTPRFVDILDEHVSPAEHVGLGKNIARAALQHAYRVVESNTNQPRNEELQAQRLERMRSYLENITISQGRILQEQLLSEPHSEWLMDRLGLDMENDPDPDIALIKRLIMRQGKEPLVSDELFVNFLEWHNHALAQMQHELDAREGQLKSEFAHDIRRMVSTGELDHSLLSKLDRLDSVKLVVDDGLQTDMMGLRGVAESAKDGSAHIIVIAPSQLGDVHSVLWHELLHILDGHSERMGEEGDESAFSSLRSHGLNRLFGAEKGGEVMNEVIVEHLSVALLEDKDPYEGGELLSGISSGRSTEGHSHIYRKEGNELFGVLLNSGVRKVGLRGFVSTHFEDGADARRKGEGSFESMLVNDLRRAFPFTDVIDEIKKLRTKDEVSDYARSLKKRSMLYKLRHGVRTGGKHAA
jgi:hypothetical protein